MEFRPSKIEIGIVILTFVGIGFFRLIGTASPEALPVQDISYEMPRPKSDLVGEFGLGHREVDRRYVNPFEKKAAAAADGSKSAKLPPKVAKAKPKKPVAYRPGYDPRRDPRFMMNVVDKNRSGFSTENDLDSNLAPPSADMISRQAAGAQDDEGVENKKDRLSPAQWRSLLSAQPTRENMEKLVDALSKGEADEATFYQIVEEFLKDQNTEKHAVALHGLSQRPTLASFKFAAGLVATLPTDAKPGVEQYLQSFSAPSRHSVLLAALQSSDRDIALRAAQVVLTGIQTAQAPPTDPREVRGQQAAVNWSRFTLVFQRWAASGDANLQGIASSILALLPQAQA